MIEVKATGAELKEDMIEVKAAGAELEEGLFRLSGSNTVVRQLRDRFNAEGDLDFAMEAGWVDVHAVASLLKQYLRELPDMVLTRELHLQFVQILGTCAFSSFCRVVDTFPTTLPIDHSSPSVTCFLPHFHHLSFVSSPLYL